MALSQKLAQKMRGYIEVRSEKGKGTTMCVSLLPAQGLKLKITVNSNSQQT
jgi:signal transduction histidine kinase